MSTVTPPSPSCREPGLLAQTVIVIGGRAGIGFETARRAPPSDRHILTNTALTGATYDIDGGQQFVAAWLKKPV